MRFVNQPIRKKDAEQLLSGKPVYTQDIAPKDCLVVKILRSKYANAIIRDIDFSAAMKVDGMEAVFTWKDVPQDSRRFTLAGETYPNTSPFDRLILDRHMRHVGDVAAIVAGRDEKCVNKALSLIKVDYEVLEPVIDFHKALDNPVVVHPEDNWELLCPLGADRMRNLCSHSESSNGDVDEVLKGCDVVIDRTYHTKPNQQCMMEPFCTWCSIDAMGRLNVVSSTQIVFHCRKIIAAALGIPNSKVHVSKPRIGGGFGAKQTSVSEIYPAFVTWKTKKPSMIVFTREECMTASSPRHEMELHVRVGASKDGKIRAIDLYTLSNTGAYGEHGPTTVGLSGHKSIPIYRTEAYRFRCDVVYTNVMSAGAYRGYGATQGIFAVESAVNELAHALDMDPMDIREKNMVHEGDIMPAYYDQLNTSCALDKCLARVRKMIDWDNKYPVKYMGGTKVRSVGTAMAMQSSGITNIDVGSAIIKLEEGGFYTLLHGAGDMGTGCDTILAQIAAEVLECDCDMINVPPADTDTSPYDSGSYASRTTYLTGKAVENCARSLREKIIALGARMLGCETEDAEFNGEQVICKKDGKSVSLFELTEASTTDNNLALIASDSHSSSISPPPFIVGAVELETDLETGEVKVINYAAAVDCGTPVNTNLARVQAEGGIVQGIGMALTENVTYDGSGHVLENSFMQYKIPSRLDIGHIDVVFESSYEKEGPFGAKSIGEVVINTSAPAIADAVYNATGERFRELPITPEKIAMAVEKNGSPFLK